MTFFKNKKGGNELLAVILIPVMIFVIFNVILAINNENVLNKRLQSGLDSALSYAASLGEVVEVKDENGNQYSVCSFENAVIEDLKEKIITDILSQINGYNSTWSDGFEIQVITDEDSEQKIYMRVVGYAPSENITDYQAWYEKNKWNSTYSNTITVFAEGKTTCR